MVARWHQSTRPEERDKIGSTTNWELQRALFATPIPTHSNLHPAEPPAASLARIGQVERINVSSF
jgi:hypothetical protein